MFLSFGIVRYRERSRVVEQTPFHKGLLLNQLSRRASANNFSNGDVTLLMLLQT